MSKKKSEIKKYVGCYAKQGPIKRVRIKYNPDSKRYVPTGEINKETKEPIKKLVSNNGKGYKYEIVIEYGKVYEFDLSKPEIKFMVDNLIRGGKIKEVEEPKVIENEEIKEA